MAVPQNKKKKRRIAYLEPIQRIYIFCEGIQTEPNYFEGFKSAIECNAIYKNAIKIQVEGVGADTVRVINKAEKFIKENQITDAMVWCVYDKDSFPAHSFNSVSEKANALNAKKSKVKYLVGWSNECIEYWFLLHFSYYDANNNRKEYKEFLDKRFREIGLKRYEKNNPNLFTILTNYGNPKLAMRYAARRIQECRGKN